MDPFSWQCPYCRQHSTITFSNYSEKSHVLSDENVQNQVALNSYFVVCPNATCKRYTLTATLTGTHGNATTKWPNLRDVKERWRLMPFGTARAFQEFVPKAIRNDYEEASRILDLSPKAAATLARRAVQGVIRGFWGISKARLIDELSALKERPDVPQEIWEAIDALRKVGNIGAHMEKDIDLIIDVEPGEAKILIEFVEMLIEETYVARDQRQKRLAGVKKVATDKATAKNTTRATAAPADPIPKE